MRGGSAAVDRKSGSYNRMDNTTSGALGLVALVISVGSTLLVAINHKRIRSNCCGRSIEASFDVENTSPNIQRVAPTPPSLS